MDGNTDTANIKVEISKLQAEKAELDCRIRLLESLLNSNTNSSIEKEEGKKDKDEEGITKCLSGGACSGGNFSANGGAVSANGLTPDMIYRYSRHLLLPNFGVEGQGRLSSSSILVVGAGGLGSPIAMYLAACGVGCLGIVDGDFVELSNLHRQIIHMEGYVGQPKVKSAAAYCRAINSSVKVVEHPESLQPNNALDIVRKYDIVVDATDNLPSRYMISDCCVVLKKPLISGAALGLEGQMTVYNYNGGPCYRCLFPNPPPVAACQSCSDSGVLGVVPGVVGCLQALEAIKVAAAVGEPLSGRMLLFDALSTHIRIVKIRGRSPLCTVCGESSVFNEQDFQRFDYEGFTKSPMSDRSRPKLSLLPENARITSREYREVIERGESHVLLDVRPAHHFKIASISCSLNIPLAILEDNLTTLDPLLKEVGDASGKNYSLYVVCRRGNDSQRAVKILQENGFLSAKDIIGGLESWAQDVDPNFPMY